MSCGYNIKSLTLHELPEIMDIGHRAYNISWSNNKTMLLFGWLLEKFCLEVTNLTIG